MASSPRSNSRPCNNPPQSPHDCHPYLSPKLGQPLLLRGLPNHFGETLLLFESEPGLLDRYEKPKAAVEESVVEIETYDDGSAAKKLEESWSQLGEFEKHGCE